MQLRFKTHRRLHSCADRKGYPGAREFAIIQNIVAWHIPDFEDSCPLPVRSSGAPKKRRRGHRGGRRGGNASNPDAAAQTVHAAAQAAESELSPESEKDSIV